jgi:hypothetical protein
MPPSPSLLPDMVPALRSDMHARTRQWVSRSSPGQKRIWRYQYPTSRAQPSPAQPRLSVWLLAELAIPLSYLEECFIQDEGVSLQTVKKATQASEWFGSCSTLVFFGCEDSYQDMQTVHQGKPQRLPWRWLQLFPEVPGEGLERTKSTNCFKMSKSPTGIRISTQKKDVLGWKYIQFFCTGLELHQFQVVMLIASLTTRC